MMPSQDRTRPTAALVMAPVIFDLQFPDDRIERLETLCHLHRATPFPGFEDPDASSMLSEVEILITGWGCPSLDAEVLRSAPALRAAFHAAGTVKNHVTEACWERGLRISSAAAANAVSVAEFTVAAILFSNKHVFELRRRYAEVRQFRLWWKESPGLGNYRKRVGLVGASRIGRRVIELLRPFDLDVAVSDPFLRDDAARELGVELLDLDVLLAGSDVVSLHAPALPETRELLDARRLALLRDGTTLINTARGWLVDGKALERELVSGRIRAVLDTTDPEILPSDSPLYELPNVFLTPHIAGAMGTETRRLTDLCLDEVERFVRGEPLLYEVHREDLPRIA